MQFSLHNESKINTVWSISKMLWSFTFTTLSQLASCWEMTFKVDYIFSLTIPVLFKASAMCYDTILINSRVSGFIWCIIYPNQLIFYDTGTLRHSYKNKANNVRLLPVFTFFTSFSTVPSKILFCHGKNPTLQYSTDILVRLDNDKVS